MQKKFSGCTTEETIRRPHHVTLMSAKNWTVKFEKILPSLMSLDFCYNTWMVDLEFDTSCIVSMVSLVGGVMVYGIFSWYTATENF